MKMSTSTVRISQTRQKQNKNLTQFYTLVWCLLPVIPILTLIFYKAEVISFIIFITVYLLEMNYRLDVGIALCFIWTEQ